jgi:hypothetical protein
MLVFTNKIIYASFTYYQKSSKIKLSHTMSFYLLCLEFYK